MSTALARREANSLRRDDLGLMRAEGFQQRDGCRTQIPNISERLSYSEKVVVFRNPTSNGYPILNIQILNIERVSYSDTQYFEANSLRPSDLGQIRAEGFQQRAMVTNR